MSRQGRALCTILFLIWTCFLHLLHGAGVWLGLQDAGTGSFPVCTIMSILHLQHGPGVSLELHSRVRCPEGNGRMSGSSACISKNVSIMSPAMAAPTLHSD